MVKAASVRIEACPAHLHATGKGVMDAIQLCRHVFCRTGTASPGLCSLLPLLGLSGLPPCLQTHSYAKSHIKTSETRQQAPCPKDFLHQTSHQSLPHSGHCHLSTLATCLKYEKISVWNEDVMMPRAGCCRICTCRQRASHSASSVAKAPATNSAALLKTASSHADATSGNSAPKKASKQLLSPRSRCEACWAASDICSSSAARAAYIATQNEPQTLLCMPCCGLQLLLQLAVNNAAADTGCRATRRGL